MTSQGICTKYIRSNLDANRHVQVDAYGPDDKDGRGRECSVKSWCGDDDSCLLASQYVLHAEYYSQCILVENNDIIWQTYSFNTNPIWDESYFQDEVLPEYKFLLSLESSMCKDFVTRNFFTALRQAVVPVVLGMIPLVSFVICTSAHHRFQSLLPGNADYSKLAPPKSYIDVRDFESPSHLASYLKYLMDHPKEYDSYLEWSKSYRVLNNSLASTVFVS